MAGQQPLIVVAVVHALVVAGRIDFARSLITVDGDELGQGLIGGVGVRIAEATARAQALLGSCRVDVALAADFRGEDARHPHDAHAGGFVWAVGRTRAVAVLALNAETGPFGRGVRANDCAVRQGHLGIGRTGEAQVVAAAATLEVGRHAHRVAFAFPLHVLFAEAHGVEDRVVIRRSDGGDVLPQAVGGVAALVLGDVLLGPTGCPDLKPDILRPELLIPGINSGLWPSPL